MLQQLGKDDSVEGLGHKGYGGRVCLRMRLFCRREIGINYPQCVTLYIKLSPLGDPVPAQIQHQAFGWYFTDAADMELIYEISTHGITKCGPLRVDNAVITADSRLKDQRH